MNNNMAVGKMTPIARRELRLAQAWTQFPPG